MARTIPLLPCPDLDEAVAFYEALGFDRTYRQVRPNPYASVVRGDLEVHLFGMEGFDPAQSYASAIFAVEDVDLLYAGFAAGLRAAFGKLPVAGIPRILRPRKRHGTVRGFSVVDPGGNWLRFSALDERAGEDGERTTGLARVVANAARLGDAHGDDAAALSLLDAGLAKFADAPAPERARALLYRAELCVRVGDPDAAVAALDDARSVPLDAGDAAALAEELAATAELVGR